MSKNIPFQKKLILNKFMLNYFGFSEFLDIKINFSDSSYEGINNEGQTNLFQEYWIKMEANPNKKITKDDFNQYDQNIIKHLNEINNNRENKITLKYFQYFALIFVEVYLDKFFANQQLFLSELNDEVDKQNRLLGLKIADYEIADLNKISIWNATGSGKTLIMHLNYLQIKYYLSKYKIDFSGAFILLTPSETLSQQHLIEYKLSGISAKSYEKDTTDFFIKPDNIQVIENTKLGEKEGDKTVSVQTFGNKNILFVDEGHRGSSGDKWYKYRRNLCSSGFSFEYSATFSQAVSGKKNLEDEYAKCILFDYSYKHFYSDGFGKDYKILNLPEVNEVKVTFKYLVASLLTFYQQKKLFINKKHVFKEYNIENPLMVFVGGKVTAKASNSDKSDVISIIRFFNKFISEPDDVINIINQLLNGETELINVEGTNIFSGSFDYLASLSMNSEAIYDDIVKLVFHGNNRGQLLHADNLKGIEGEIRLRIGDNESFGVINVGSDTELLKLIAEEKIVTNTIDFSTSLFTNINSKGSPINILIGSKKFTEGWNSWRVSTMGLMSVGKNEGSQIIQLFGRGVRLRGKLKDGNFSLKRSKAFHQDFRFESKLQKDDMKLLTILETLNIFGLNADYMQQFKEYITSEGLNTDKETFEIIIPTVKANYAKDKLKTLRVKDGLDFVKDGPQPLFDQKLPSLVILDTYGKIQFETSLNTNGLVVTKEELSLDRRHFCGLNFEQIYFDLLEYKKEKKYWNIVFTLNMIEEKLKKSDWYKLLIPNKELEVHSYSDFKRFNRIALALLKKYLDKIFTVSRKRYEAPLLEYVEMGNDDPNFIDEYQATIENAEEYESVKELLEKIQEFTTKDRLDTVKISQSVQGVSWLNLKNSLFNPLFSVSKNNNNVKFVPTALVESEWEFLKLLDQYIEKNKSIINIDHLYIVRNASRRGVGFFEDEGFYPDFIMWYFNKNKEYIIFIEPHGMRYENLDRSQKINFAKSIKELQNSIILKDGKRPVLESFILSPTRYINLDNPSNISKEELVNRHVLFMEDGVDVITHIFDKLD